MFQAQLWEHPPFRRELVRFDSFRFRTFFESSSVRFGSDNYFSGSTWFGLRFSACVFAVSPDWEHPLRPTSVPRFWISEGLTQA